ncbi:cellulose synthase [Nocardioides sp. 616]|uniref:cellulose synthase n=1 Tax=Nocardioides sp. 616 TaxID=2268090 RepID=UPI000CE40326|nr:cellulose synthase [Nocardioides sp. 616]
MWDAWQVDEVTWGALTLTLTLLGALYTWWAFTRRGAAAGTRGAAFTLLPAAAWLTGTLEMVTEIAGSIADWATHLVFSPVVWAGVVLGGAAVSLFLLSGLLRSRQERAVPAVAGDKAGERKLPRGASARTAPVVDDDLADIEALLRKRGIN